MNVENKVAVVTDSGSSIRTDSPLVKEYGVISVPLDIKFFENGNWIPYEDTDLSPDEFYSKMRASKELPQTSGVTPGKLLKHYEELAKENRPIISIHITSRGSNVCGSATLGSKMALEKYPHLLIEIIDSKQVSIATQFLVEQAAILASEGYPLEDIVKITLETIPKINITAALSTFENIVKGGRLPAAAGFFGSKLEVRPIAGLVDGEVKLQGVTRTNKNAQKELVKRVENVKGEVVKLAIVHTNFEEGALLLREDLRRIYSGKIEIFEAGPALAVHAGERSLGVVTQKA